MLLGLLGLGTCKSQSSALQSGWEQFEVNAAEPFPPLDSSAWSYPWYMVEISPGNFENTTSDTISEQDTAHLIHNSTCQVFAPKWRDSYRLPFCRAARQNDSLNFEIYLEDASGYEALIVQVLGDQFRCRYALSSPVPFSGLQFRVINQKLILGKNGYRPGDLARGKLQAEFLISLTNAKGQRQTFKKAARGYFATIVP